MIVGSRDCDVAFCRGLIIILRFNLSYNVCSQMLCGEEPGSLHIVWFSRGVSLRVRGSVSFPCQVRSWRIESHCEGLLSKGLSITSTVLEVREISVLDSRTTDSS